MNRYGDDFPMRAAQYMYLSGRITAERAAELTRTAERLLAEHRCHRIIDLAVSGAMTKVV